MPEPTVLLIDGDIVCYKSAAAAQKTSIVVWDNDAVVGEFKNITECRANIDNLELYETQVQVYAEPEHHAFYNVKRAIQFMEDRFKPYRTIVCLSDAPTYRDMLATIRKYKGHRDPSLKPMHLRACREYLQNYYETCLMEHLEADDTIGILNSRIAEEGSKPIVCSTDKDLDQLPGYHYNFDKDIEYEVTPRQADHKLLSQALSGDSTDNIPGIEGVGPKTADQLAQGIMLGTSWREAIKNEYINKYGWDDGPKRFKETWYLVKICRSEDDVEELRAESLRVMSQNSQMA